MLCTPTRRTARPRRGAILLVVITLLALFAVIGLSFALYADAQATAARIGREAQSTTRDNTDLEAALNPGEAFNEALGQLLYDVQDQNPQKVQSGLRGYSFARLMYGQERKQPFGLKPLLSPYAGTGPFTTGTPEGDAVITPAGLKRAEVINYAYLPPKPTDPANSMYLIDPEYSWYRSNANNNPSLLTPAPGGTQVYKSIAAPYTYPDLKDLNLAVLDPSTGKILQPSFFRDYAFNTAQPNAGLRLAPPSVVPGNTDWLATNPAGRLKIIRPRPEDHIYDPDGTTGPLPATTEFPYPTPNADGSYTGDVTNFPGLNGQQRHDSIWIDFGGPIKTFRGKRYKALIAPLILDLGGRVNLSVAGNRKGANGDHASSQGAGPWEVNPRWVFDPGPTVTTRANLSADSLAALQQLLSGNPFQSANGIANVAGRYSDPVNTLVPRADKITGLNQVLFNGGRLFPQYAGADVDAASTGTAIDRAVPAGSGTSPWPTFVNTRYPDLTNLATELGNHPGQYNPEYYSRLYSAPAGGFGPFLPIDERVIGSKYAGLPEPYSRSDAGRLAPKEIISANLTGSAFNPYTTPANPQTTSTDEANITRALVTTLSTSLNRMDLAVRTGAETSPGVYPTARLGPVDLNRPLPDYRDLNHPTKNKPTPNMLGPDNMDNWAVAQAARQRMARDIFVRLVAVEDLWRVSQGQQPVIDGTNVAYVAAAPTNPAAFNDPNNDHGYLRIVNTDVAVIDPLRRLAQMAVNIVDYLDADDVSTTFTWNPLDLAAAGGVAQLHLGNILRADGLPNIGAAAGQATDTTPATMTPDQFGNHVVYGTEAPRLVLNEVYAALTNHKDDSAGPKATKSFERRFWIELFNPMRSDPALSENGLARLQYPGNVFGLGPEAGYTPYTIVITKQPAAGAFAAPANVTGSYLPQVLATGVVPATAAVVTVVNNFTYSGAAPVLPEDTWMTQPIDGATYQPPPVQPGGGNNLQMYVVHPHKTSGSGGTSRMNLNGFCVLGPEESYAGQEMSNPGEPAATLRLTALQKPIDEMTVKNTETDFNENKGDVAIHLRRLANPYLPPNDPVENIGPTNGSTFDFTRPVNPYVAVDRAENVPMNDLVKYNDAMMHTPTAGEAKDQASIGRMHPFAAALVGPQQAAVGASPKNTFFNHNDNTGLPATPLKWLVHLDRQLVSPIELAHVPAVSPGQLTAAFGQPGTPPTYNRHTMESLLLAGVGGGVQVDAPPTGPGVGYLRDALNYLAASGPQSGVPVGGRVHGKININTAWHPAVLRALLDRNDANFFRDVDVSGAPAAAWERMTTAGTAARSPVWPNVLTTTPVNPTDPHDTPFRGLGDVIFRGATAGLGSSSPPAQPRPLFYNQDPTDATIGLPVPAQDHTAVLAEPLKKMFNNVTTTSNAFAVWITVGFFEVRNPPDATGRVYLGKELYEEIPGDRRFKFFSIVDRTQLAIDPNNTSQQAPSVPWQTTLLEDALPGATSIRVAADSAGKVYVDGTEVPLGQGQKIRIGYGSGDGDPATSPTYNGGDGEEVVIDAVAPPDPTKKGQVVLTVHNSLSNGPVQRYHPAGSPVGNYVLGNPGPQLSFDPNDPRYKPVVPYFARLTGQ